MPTYPATVPSKAPSERQTTAVAAESMCRASCSPRGSQYTQVPAVSLRTSPTDMARIARAKPMPNAVAPLMSVDMLGTLSWVSTDIPCARPSVGRS